MPVLQLTQQEAEGSKCQYKFLTSLILPTGRINYSMATYTHAKKKAKTKQAGPRGKQKGMWLNEHICTFDP